MEEEIDFPMTIAVTIIGLGLGLSGNVPFVIMGCACVLYLCYRK